MRRGYALVEKEGAIITSSDKITPNDKLQLKMSDGDLHVQVTNKIKVSRW
jgi:exonuclease VII large subunit